MSRERSFKHFYTIPHNGGFIEPIIHIEYEATNWDQENTGDIDVIDAWVSRDMLTQADIDSAQAWLDQTPLDFFHDAAFENECQEWQEPPLSLQP